MNDFEKNFFKLLNNSVFGKTIENMRKRQKVELITNRRKFRNLITKLNFQSFKIFTDDLVVVYMKHTKNQAVQTYILRNDRFRY